MNNGYTKIRGQWFDNESYQLSEQECIAIADMAQRLLDIGNYVVIEAGVPEVQLTRLCEDVCYNMNFRSGSQLADHEAGTDDIVILVCAGEGLL